MSSPSHGSVSKLNSITIVKFNQPKEICYFFFCLIRYWNNHIWFSDVMIDLMQTGMELVLNSSDEDFIVAMLYSLSKLACILIPLTSYQVCICPTR